MKKNRLYQIRKSGIEAVSIYVPKHYFSLRNLAKVRNVDYNKYAVGLGCEKMSVLAHTDDPVTMGANAGFDIINKSGIDPDEIGYLVVGSESAVDESKPIAVYIHEMLGLSEDCRCMDVKNACYAGTAALKNAIAWNLSPMSNGRKALVITTDVAYYELGSAGEPTQGAAAAAVLISSDPGIISIDIENESVYTREVMDFWRPKYKNSAIVNGHYSMECYLESLEKTYLKYKKMSGLSYHDYNYFVFHTPFPKMARKAHIKLFNLEGGEEKLGITEEDGFNQKVAHTLLGAREMGNVYSSSLFLAFVSLIEHKILNNGNTVGMFSYGSGSSAEFLSGQIGNNITKWNGQTGLSDKLEKRNEVTYEDYLFYRAAYERRMRDGFYVKEEPTSKSPFIYLGIKNNRRQYAWLNSQKSSDINPSSVSSTPDKLA